MTTWMFDQDCLLGLFVSQMMREFTGRVGGSVQSFKADEELWHSVE